MSGTNLFVILIELYIYIVHNSFHTRFLTKTFLTSIIILVTLISIMRDLVYTLLSTYQDKTKKVRLYTALSIYKRILIATGVVVTLNVTTLMTICSSIVAVRYVCIYICICVCICVLALSVSSIVAVRYVSNQLYHFA